MQLAEKKAVLLVVFFFILIAPALAAGKGTKSSGDGGIFLSLYQEQYQNAFYILIPKGWKAEGGMVPSGAQWNVVDLVENNIRFRVTSPDGKSFFGWYPRFYFQDPQVIMQSSGGGGAATANRASLERMLDLPLSGCRPICSIHCFSAVRHQ